MVDCMLSYALTHLVLEMSDPGSVEGRDMLERVKAGAGAHLSFRSVRSSSSSIQQPADSHM